MPCSFAECLLAPYPHGPVSVTFERFAARVVLGVDLRQELVKVELAKGVAGAEPHRLGRVALAPRALLADHDPGGPVRVQPVDAVDAGGADGLVRDFDDPPDVILRFADLLQELLLLLKRDRHTSCKKARDVHVGEPAHEVLRIVFTRGPERDLLAAKQWSEHGSGQNSRGCTSTSGGATTLTKPPAAA